MRGVYVNERATPPMPQWKVHQDLRRLSGMRPDWVATNELAKLRRYRHALRVWFPTDEWRHLFLNRRKRNTISVRRDTYRVLDSYSVRLTRGLAGVNPARRANVAIVQDRDTNEPFALVCVHLTNGKDNPRRSFRTWRARSWARGYARLTRLVARLDASGLPVLVVGDFNDKDTPLPHPAAWWVTNNGRIVKAAAVGMDARGRALRGLHTDHPALLIRGD